MPSKTPDAVETFETLRLQVLGSRYTPKFYDARDSPQYPMVPTVCLLDHDCNALPTWHWLFRRLPDPLWRWWLARHADDYVCP